jgi:hypothetical protein
MAGRVSRLGGQRPCLGVAFVILAGRSSKRGGGVPPESMDQGLDLGNLDVEFVIANRGAFRS